MPTTKKEQVYFGLMMCSGMVVFMTFYNLYMHDLLDTLSWKSILVQLILTFFIAFILESCIVGPVAKKIAFSLPYDKSKKLFGVVSVAFFMVCGMVLCMSLYGLGTAYLSNPLMKGTLFENYYSLVLQNFIFAFPLQLLIIGPIVRFLFQKFVKDKGPAKSVHS
ncbi:hypothetical protein [Paenibacillus alvei]|uniref:hypothetical protein n=1 Tax=Paenibacillus alvei TaxID=44250 RepID=UPI0004102C9B|nr:hypothetical protein [Paenibacillus alvei]